MNDNNVRITRGTIGQIASIVTALGLLATVLAALWRSGFDTITFIPLGITIISIIVWGVATPDEFRNFITGRQVRFGTSAVFSTLLLLGIVVMIYVFLERAVITADMTLSESFSLSQPSLDVLEGVRRPIQITGFYPPSLVNQREVDDQFFRLYTTATDGLITRRYIDPAEQPALAEAFRAQGGDVFLSYLNEDGNIDFESVAYVPLTGTQERDMTEAISRLLISGEITVYFEQGLGEIDPLDNSGTGMSLANALLQENGLITQPINIEALAAQDETVPLDATAIILARPRVQPSEGAIRVLDDYLNRGGSLFIMADTQSEFMTGDSPFNTYLWENYGLRMMDAVVVDFGASGATELDVLSAAVFASEIAGQIDPTDPESLAQFRLVRPIEVNEEPPVANGRVIMSSQASYAETNLETLFQRNEYTPDTGEDMEGPLTLVAFADDRNSETGTGARIVLVGDSDFVTNGQISSPFGNAYLFTGGLGWLTDFNRDVSFTPEPRVTNIPAIFISSQQLDTIGFFTAIIMPGIALLLGIAVWYMRGRS